MNPLLKSQKIGFIGAGNMAHAMIRGLVSAQVIKADHIHASNRSPGKLQKLVEDFGIKSENSNEAVIENCDILILATKPQDLLSVLEPAGRLCTENQVVISLAAGVRMQTLKKYLPQCRIVRLMPNTPTLIQKGILAYLIEDEDQRDILSDICENLFSPLGSVIELSTEEQIEAVTVACSSGTGFVYELMMYWMDWIEEHDFDPDTAKKIVIETFLGTAQLALQSRETSLEDLQNRVSSRKGVTAAGLQSMRELEIERALRISFEKAAMRSSEIARENN